MTDHQSSAGTVDPEKAEIAERFRLFGEKGFRPEVFGIDDRVPGPMVTQRDCMLIAAALSSAVPQEAQETDSLRRALELFMEWNAPERYFTPTKNTDYTEADWCPCCAPRSEHHREKHDNDCPYVAARSALSLSRPKREP